MGRARCGQSGHGDGARRGDPDGWSEGRRLRAPARTQVIGAASLAKPRGNKHVKRMQLIKRMRLIERVEAGVFYGQQKQWRGPRLRRDPTDEGGACDVREDE